MTDIPTSAEISVELEIVAEAMQATGERMAYLGGFGEIGDHGREMIGAAGIAREWAMRLRGKMHLDDLESGMAGF